jgi:hypothetical protein
MKEAAYHGVLAEDDYGYAQAIFSNRLNLTRTVSAPTYFP